MNENNITVKRVLISVSDKTGIVEFARELVKLDIEIISTGGTKQLLNEAGIAVRDVAEVTGFPEMMNGRVKTLHPKIHGGILGRRETDAEVANAHQIHWIDLVVVNLYPFAETIKKADVSLDEAIENIDIGGPSLIRAAAKNIDWVTVVTDVQDYAEILRELREGEGISFTTRKALAVKAFNFTSCYDEMIFEYLENVMSVQNEQDMPNHFKMHLKKQADLRYGENPHQAASAYSLSEKNSGILSAKQYQGKQLSYNNIVDADAAISCVSEFSEAACVIVKHANPCGVAVGDNMREVFSRAYHADALSAFGGAVALNRMCTKEVAEAITKNFIEVLIAPAYSVEALAILAGKVNLRVLELDMSALSDSTDGHRELKWVTGGVLIQDKDTRIIRHEDLKVVTQRQPSEQEINTMLFAWRVLKYIKSNGILIAKDHTTIGIGAGQVSRVDSVDIALKKSGDKLQNTILASDAFFPFRDSIDHIANKGISAVIQPGGSMRDAEVIAACNEHNIAMVFTGVRCFKH